jgi:hypothetical protein
MQTKHEMKVATRDTYRTATLLLLEQNSNGHMIAQIPSEFQCLINWSMGVANGMYSSARAD